MIPAILAAARQRLLPLSIALMALVLVGKVATLILGSAAPAVLVDAGRAVLPAAQAASGAHAPAPKQEAKPAATQPPPTLPQQAQPAPPAPPPEPAISEAERTLLQDLRARRTALDARAETIAAREAMLAAAERRLSERVDQLTAMQTRLEALEQTRRERDEANWRGLVKTYETMRPKDAAAIFNDLEQAVLIQVLDRMKEAKVAPVLAAMQPDRARAVTAQLVQWRNRKPEGPAG